MEAGKDYLEWAARLDQAIEEYPEVQEYFDAIWGNIEALATRLEAVRELHKPTIEGVITGDCATDECDHEDECPLEPIEVCAECHRLAEEVDAYYGEETIEPTTWPCPTIQAIEGDQ